MARTCRQVNLRRRQVYITNNSVANETQIAHWAIYRADAEVFEMAQQSGKMVTQLQTTKFDDELTSNNILHIPVQGSIAAFGTCRTCE